MAQKTLKEFFPSKKKTEESSKDIPRKRSLDSYAVPRGKKRKVATVLTVQKDIPNTVSSTSKQAKKTKVQSNSTATPVVSLAVSKAISEKTENTLSETTRTCAAPRSEPKNAKASLSDSPLSRGAACLKLALDKDKSSPLMSRGKEQVTSFRETRRKLFTGPSEGSTSSSIIIKDEKDTEPPHHPAQASHVPSPMKKQQKNTPDSMSAPKLNHFKALQYDSPTKRKR